MFAKLFHWNPSKDDNAQEAGKLKELDSCIAVHYGIPSTASILAFDPIQRILAIGTLDGRIKVIGGNNIEGLLTSPKSLQFKHLQFLQNQGFLVSISVTNEIQVWDMEHRKIASMLKWEMNITAFSVIDGTSFMYIGDDYAMVSVVKYDAETGTIVQLPYHVPGSFVAEASGVELPYRLPVVGILPQPSSKGNRILIAYANGLIALWDASENKAAWVGGHKALMPKDIEVVHIPNDSGNQSPDDRSTNEQVEKEISSLCWASTDGSTLAVGYVDGDILFWNLSTVGFTKDQQEEKSSGDVVKLQLSSGAKRRPVVILRQSANRSHNNRGCQLLVYGGDEIGSEQVPTILSLDWSSGIETLKCTARVDITLNGGLMDTIFLPTADMMAKDTCLLVLINPGKLHLYDDACLSELMSQQERKTSASAPQYQSVMTVGEPHFTVRKLCLIESDAKLRVEDTSTEESTKWPLTGGVPNQLRSAEDYKVARLYIAGYGDGIVKIWDATYPSMYLMYALGSEVSSVSFSQTALSVSAVDFCSVTLRVAVGYLCGLVRLYELVKSSDEDTLHLVTETENEVIIVHQGDGPRYRAAISILDSPISTLQFANSGAKLAAGFECGKVAVLDISSLSVLFLTDCVSTSSSPVISLTAKSLSDTNCSQSSEKDTDSKCLNDPEKLALFGLTKDANIFVIDGGTGKIITSNSVPKESMAISMHIIERNISPGEVSGEEDRPKSSQNSGTQKDLAQTNPSSENIALELAASTGTAYFGKRLTSFLVLFCFENELCLYSLKSLLQEDSNAIKEVKLVKPCCWISILEKDENECVLAVLYQTGDIEIRTMPDLEVVAASSVKSILRWDFSKTDKTMCCSDSGHIVLVNGHEYAIVSLLAHEIDFRIPESLPCLHDKALAASDAALYSSPSQNKRESGGPGLLGGFIKALKGEKVEQNVNPYEVYRKNIPQLANIFSKDPTLEPESIDIPDDQKPINLNIDNIVEGWMGAKAASNKTKIEVNGPTQAGPSDNKATERKKLLEGGSTTTDMKPQKRTPEDIRAKYRQMGGVATAAALAKDKLVERQEKLEELTEQTQELEDEAQDFAAMAKELAKKMERRKWWQL